MEEVKVGQIVKKGMKELELTEVVQATASEIGDNFKRPRKGTMQAADEPARIRQPEAAPVKVTVVTGQETTLVGPPLYDTLYTRNTELKVVQNSRSEKVSDCQCESKVDLTVESTESGEYNDNTKTLLYINCSSGEYIDEAGFECGCELANYNFDSTSIQSDTVVENSVEFDNANFELESGDFDANTIQSDGKLESSADSV